MIQGALYWARRDLRLRDNHALTNAVAHAKQCGGPLLPVYVIEDYMTQGSPSFQFGLAQRSLIRRAVPAYFKQFPQNLIVSGLGARTIGDLVDFMRSLGIVMTVFVNEDVYPDFYTQIKRLTQRGIALSVCTDRLTVSKDTRTGTGNLYSIFTPFKRSVWNSFVDTKPLKSVDPKAFHTIESEVFNKLCKLFVPLPIDHSGQLDAALFSSSQKMQFGDEVLDLQTLNLPEADYSPWYTTESEALTVAKSFVASKLNAYKRDRDMLDLPGTSRLSLALAWGFLSARTLTEAVLFSGHRPLEHASEQLSEHLSDATPLPVHKALLQTEGQEHYISELIWREFYGYLLFHQPELMQLEYQPRYRGTIDWEPHPRAKQRFIAWIEGRSGYDIVDAAMLELAHSGYMHNRARMIVASVLTKNLGVDWKWGQEYFRAKLIDLDEASNNGGWQWGASVGADPKPIRIFNPYLQAERFDGALAYRKQWLPEDRLKTPIQPMVEHTIARQEALARYGLTR